QQRPCDSDSLPPSRGETGFFQPDGFASFAGQTKKASRLLHRPLAQTPPWVSQQTLANKIFR
ncbi:hypothetical protein, partial [Marinomonas arctica]|uniref:hypothetical protein n=1 Tax=Marinomonas arctica TaxID=383750 RepID=UPI001E5C75B6